MPLLATVATCRVMCDHVRRGSAALCPQCRLGAISPPPDAATTLSPLDVAVPNVDARGGGERLPIPRLVPPCFARSHQPRSWDCRCGRHAGRVINDWKAYATRSLRLAGLAGPDDIVWKHGGNARRIGSPD